MNIQQLVALRDAVVKYPERQNLCGPAFIDAVALLERVGEYAKWLSHRGSQQNMAIGKHLSAILEE